MLAHVERDTKQLVRQLGLSDHLLLLEHAWETELGRLAKMARIVALDRTILVVEADSSPAVQEISLRRKELIRRLNRHFPSEFIYQITVRTSNHG